VIRPTVATVDLAAIQANVRAIRGLLAGTVRPPAAPPGIIGVVKANAYGHGADRVGPALEAAGVAMLACADIEEGVALRETGVTIPILVFGALSVSDVAGVFDHELTPTVSTPAAARALERAAADRGVRLGCHLKIDTGMNRLGFRHDNLRRTLPDVLGSPHLAIESVYTHFATAGDPESSFFEEQRVRFDRAVAALRAMGLPAGPSLTSRIVAVKGIRAGEGTSYGLRWTAEGPRSLAIIPAGYADGLDTRMGGRASVLIRGRRVPVVGAVCMDMLAADVTGLDVSPGDEVVIIGRQDDEQITAREVAAAIGSIPWEVLCRLGARIERRYWGREK